MTILDALEPMLRASGMCSAGPRCWVGQRPHAPSVAEPPRSWLEVARVAAGTFVEAGFRPTVRQDIRNQIGTTHFISAGLQIFEPALLGLEGVATGPLFVPQPVIRLNYLERAGRDEGISSSFLNLCTEQARATPTDLESHVRVWLDLLDRLRLVDAQLSIVEDYLPWGVAGYEGHRLVLAAGRIELGDIIAIHRVPDLGACGQVGPIVDCSFGLERLVCAAARGIGFHSPLVTGLTGSATSPVRADLLKTATLIALDGTRPSGRGAGRTLRQLLRLVAAEAKADPYDIERSVKEAHSLWATFIAAPAPLQAVTTVITRGAQAT